jgi:hypothetical protein
LSIKQHLQTLPSVGELRQRLPPSAKSFVLNLIQLPLSVSLSIKVSLIRIIPLIAISLPNLAKSLDSLFHQLVVKQLQLSV